MLSFGEARRNLAGLPGPRVPGVARRDGPSSIHDAVAQLHDIAKEHDPL